LVPHGDVAPIVDHSDLHSTIDAIDLGNIPWQTYTAHYRGLRPENGPTPEWMTVEYQLCYRDPRKVIRGIFANPDLADNIDYIPYRDFKDDKRQYCDFMSGDWSWEQCVSELHEAAYTYCTDFSMNEQDIISADVDTHGAIFIPIILGSDKTTVSVATGQHEYHPVYMSIGNVRNHIRRAHKDALVLIGFLPIPKGEFITILKVHSLISQKVLEGILITTRSEIFVADCFMDVSP